MDKTGWKITAIIFILIALSEFLFICWAYNYGTEVIEQENECVYNICEDYDSYSYYEDLELCSCYTDGELIIQEYMGN